MSEPKPASIKNIEFDTGVLMERKRIIALLHKANLLCRSDYKCFACNEWEMYNGNEYKFCEQLLAEIEERKK